MYGVVKEEEISCSYLFLLQLFAPTGGFLQHDFDTFKLMRCCTDTLADSVVFAA